MTNLKEHNHDDDGSNLLNYSNDGKNESLELTPYLANKVIQNLNEGIVITDTNGTILHVNQAYCLITGYSKEELLGGNPRVLKSDLHDRFFYQKIWNSVVANGSWKGEIWNRHKSGRLYLQKLYILPIRNDRNETVQYLGVSTDISEEDRIHKDIIRTSKLQKSLLPDPIKEESIEVDSVFAPSNFLSGDFYDYHWDQETGILSGFVIDIMGHGLTAAFQHSILRVLFNQRFDKNTSLVKVLTEVNRDSKSYFLEDTFAAALCFRLDTKNKTLYYACAGMNKFLKVQPDGEVSMIKLPGPYLGIMKDVDFEEGVLKVEEGASLYFLTDGLMDYFDKEGLNQFSLNFSNNMDLLRAISDKGLKDDASGIGVYIR